ncbi:MAG: glycosyltransferase [Alphaproteobacteria bacterium]|nr:glycosyltransferase [Alphaproteobacteria bacterium]
MGLARAALQAGAFDAALAALAEADRAEPENPDIAAFRALALARAGRQEEAITACRTALGLRPDHAAGLEILAAAEFARADFAAASETLQRLLAVEPSRSELWLKLAGCDAAQGAFERAQARLGEGLERCGWSAHLIQALDSILARRRTGRARILGKLLRDMALAPGSGDLAGCAAAAPLLRHIRDAGDAVAAPRIAAPLVDAVARIAGAALADPADWHAIAPATGLAVEPGRSLLFLALLLAVAATSEGSGDAGVVALRHLIRDGAMAPLLRLHAHWVLVALGLEDGYPEDLEPLFDAVEPAASHAVLAINHYDVSMRNVRRPGAYHRTAARLLARARAHQLDVAGPVPPVARRADRIALLAAALVDPQRDSGARLVLSTARHLSLAFPGVRVRLFVSDCGQLPAPPVPYGHLSSFRAERHASTTDAAAHALALDGTTVEIAYRPPGPSDVAAVRRWASGIAAWSPRAVIAVHNSFDLATELLFDHVPIVHLPFMDLVHVNSADIHLCTHPIADCAAAVAATGLDPALVERYRPFRTGLDIPAPRRSIDRSAAGIGADRVLGVTVGYRLDEDMTAPFLDIMAAAMRRHPTFDWLLVGPAEHRLARERLGELWTDRVRALAFEEDLPALLRMCDICVNPFRRGGGFTAAIAMDAGVPVVTCAGGASDVAAYVGEEQSAADPAAYAASLDRLLADAGARVALGAQLRDRLAAAFSPQAAARALMAAVDEAEAIAERRGVPRCAAAPEATPPR